MRWALFFTLLSGVCAMFAESNLPIMVFNTLSPIGTCYKVPSPCDAKEIPINGTLTIYPGGSNADEIEFYNISMKVHGQSTALVMEKQAYGFDILASLMDLEDTDDVSLLNFTKEHKFMVKGPYADFSLMRDTLGFAASRQQGHYASLYRHVELYIAPFGMTMQSLDFWQHYKGVYILEEKYKRGKNRIDITKQNFSLADFGGWILGVDKFVLANTTLHPPDYIFKTTRNTTIQIDQPDVAEFNESLRATASSMVLDYMNDFETALFGEYFMDPENGWQKYLNISFAVDYFIHTELTTSVDAYRFSINFYKDSCETNPNDCKLKMGPVWDFDLSMGMCGKESDVAACNTIGWRFEYEVKQWLNGYNPPETNLGNYLRLEGPNTAMWYARLMSDPVFKRAAAARWRQLRQTTWTNEWFMNFITDTSEMLKAGGAVKRNFDRWITLGFPIWPVRPTLVKTYDEEITLLKNWIGNRTAWLDGAFARPIYHLGTAEGTTCDIRDNNGTYTSEGPDCIVGPSGEKCGGPYPETELYKCMRRIQIVMDSWQNPAEPKYKQQGVDGSLCSMNAWVKQYDGGKCPGVPAPGSLFCNRGVCLPTAAAPSSPTSNPTLPPPTMATDAPTEPPSMAPTEGSEPPTDGTSPSSPPSTGSQPPSLPPSPGSNPPSAKSPTGGNAPSVLPPSVGEKEQQGEDSSGGSPTPIIIGVVIGIIVFVGLAVAGFLFRRKRARPDQHESLLQSVN